MFLISFIRYVTTQESIVCSETVNSAFVCAVIQNLMKHSGETALDEELPLTDRYKTTGKSFHTYIFNSEKCDLLWKKMNEEGSRILPSDDPVFMLESLKHTKEGTTINYLQSNTLVVQGNGKTVIKWENWKHLMKMWDFTWVWNTVLGIKTLHTMHGSCHSGLPRSDIKSQTSIVPGNHIFPYPLGIWGYREVWETTNLSKKEWCK